MVYVKKLDNGIRLVVKQMEGLMSVSMGVLVGTAPMWRATPRTAFRTS